MGTDTMPPARVFNRPPPTPALISAPPAEEPDLTFFGREVKALTRGEWNQALPRSMVLVGVREGISRYRVSVRWPGSCPNNWLTTYARSIAEALGQLEAMVQEVKALAQELDHGA